MERWIRDLINSAIYGLSTVINAVVERITWVYNVFITFGIRVRTAFDRAITGIRTKLFALTDMARQAYTTMHWLIFIRIPQVVGSAVHAATTYVLQQLHNVQLFLRGLIDGAIDWAWRQIQRIDAFIDQVINWAATKINALTDTLSRVASIVGALLTDPRRLAVWAIDAIMGEFLRWVDRNADRVFRLVAQRSVEYALRFAGRIEDMIARLL